MGALILAAALAVPARAETIRVLTLNVAGVPVAHSKVRARVRAIGEALASRRHDVVAIQEAWLDKDARAVADQAGLPHYARYERRLSIGTGLATLSRFPFREKAQARFTSRPSAIRAAQGESVANKGVLLTRLATPWGPLDLYNTHLIANYPSGRYYTLRLTQLFELAEMVERHSADRPFLIVGDLNTAPGEDEFQALLDLLGLEDACPSCAPTSNQRRIDHVLLPRGARRGWVKARLAFTGEAPGLGLPWSDHYGVEADLDRRVMKLRLNPDPELRAEALARIDKAVGRMVELMLKRRARRAWLPLYGFGMTLRYDKQISQLLEIQARVQTARVQTLARL